MCSSGNKATAKRSKSSLSNQPNSHAPFKTPRQKERRAVTGNSTAHTSRGPAEIRNTFHDAVMTPTSTTTVAAAGSSTSGSRTITSGSRTITTAAAANNNNNNNN